MVLKEIENTFIYRSRRVDSWGERQLELRANLLGPTSQKLPFPNVDILGDKAKIIEIGAFLLGAHHLKKSNVDTATLIKSE